MLSFVSHHEAVRVFPAVTLFCLAYITQNTIQHPPGNMPGPLTVCKDGWKPPPSWYVRQTKKIKMVSVILGLSRPSVCMVNDWQLKPLHGCGRDLDTAAPTPITAPNVVRARWLNVGNCVLIFVQWEKVRRVIHLTVHSPDRGHTDESRMCYESITGA